MAYIVTATQMVAKLDNSERYFEKGDVLPAGVSNAECKRLVAAGVVAYVKDEVKEDAGADAAAAAAAQAAADAKAEADAKAAAAKTPAK